MPVNGAYIYHNNQERIIERLKDQRDRDDREKGEELDCNKKELKELKERVSVLQGDLSDREVSEHTLIHIHTQTLWLFIDPVQDAQSVPFSVAIHVMV